MNSLSVFLPVVMAAIEPCQVGVCGASVVHYLIVVVNLPP